MSQDDERRETSREARIETGKEQLRLAQLVLTAYTEGLGLSETARRINRSRKTAWKLRVWLGLQLGSYSRGGQSRDTLRAVRP